MYLFKDQEEIEISITCKLCLKEIKFPISVNEYKKISDSKYAINSSLINRIWQIVIVIVFFLVSGWLITSWKSAQPDSSSQHSSPRYTLKDG